MPAEPVIALVLPIAAGVVVLHPHGGDVFGILEAELGGNADLDREPVGPRQDLVIEFELELYFSIEMLHARRAGAYPHSLNPETPDMGS